MRFGDRSCGQVSFELVLLCALLALGCAVGLRVLAAGTENSLGWVACGLVSKLGLSGDCESSSVVGVARLPRAAAGHDSSAVFGSIEQIEGRGLDKRPAPYEARFLGIGPDEIRASLVAEGFTEIEAALRSGAIYRALHPGPDGVLLTSAAEDWFRQAGGGSGRPKQLRLVWDNPNPRPGPGGAKAGRALARALGIAGLFVEGMFWAGRMLNEEIPPQLVVPIDGDHAVVLDWQLGGVAALGMVSGGEASELRGLVRLEHSDQGPVLTATAYDGPVFAQKRLTEEEWTLHLEALPEPLARRIREQPEVVWDPTVYPELEFSPALRPGEQLVEFHGIVYVRNTLTGTLRPLFAADGNRGQDPNAAIMSVGDGPAPPGEAGSTGDEDDDGPPATTVAELLERAEALLVERGWRPSRHGKVFAWMVYSPHRLIAPQLRPTATTDRSLRRSGWNVVSIDFDGARELFVVASEEGSFGFTPSQLAQRIRRESTNGDSNLPVHLTLNSVAPEAVLQEMADALGVLVAASVRPGANAPAYSLVLPSSWRVVVEPEEVAVTLPAEANAEEKARTSPPEVDAAGGSRARSSGPRRSAIPRSGTPSFDGAMRYDGFLPDGVIAAGSPGSHGKEPKSRGWFEDRPGPGRIRFVTNPYPNMFVQFERDLSTGERRVVALATNAVLPNRASLQPLDSHVPGFEERIVGDVAVRWSYDDTLRRRLVSVAGVAAADLEHLPELHRGYRGIDMNDFLSAASIGDPMRRQLAEVALVAALRQDAEALVDALQDRIVSPRLFGPTADRKQMDDDSGRTLTGLAREHWRLVLLSKELPADMVGVAELRAVLARAPALPTKRSRTRYLLSGTGGETVFPEVPVRPDVPGIDRITAESRPDRVLLPNFE